MDVEATKLAEEMGFSPEEVERRLGLVVESAQKVVFGYFELGDPKTTLVLIDTRCPLSELTDNAVLRVQVQLRTRASLYDILPEAAVRQLRVHEARGASSVLVMTSDGFLSTQSYSCGAPPSNAQA